MPRDGSNIYHRPPGTDGIPNYTIESAKYNANVADVEQDLNTPRPIVAGGTGANSAVDARFNLAAETATQVVTNYSSHMWTPGSFYSAGITGDGAPVDGHKFAGVCYIGEALANPPTNQNVVVEARDLDEPTQPGSLYTRQKKAGVWSAWSVLGPSLNVILNGDFRINQNVYVSGAVLAAGLYGHDQWKAGASGGNYSFTHLASGTQINIASGKSLIQPIEDSNVIGGSYVLSWAGTAQARAGVNTLTPTGAYADSPLLITGQTAGTVMSVEFTSGTLGKVRLESGTSVTPFIMRPFDQELAACERYFEAVSISAWQAGFAGIPINFFTFRVTKRANPTTNASTPTFGGGANSATVNSSNVYGISAQYTSAGAGSYLTGWALTADARL